MTELSASASRASGISRRLASPQKRLFAKAVDFGLVVVLTVTPEPIRAIGLFLAFFYSLTADGFGKPGLGKRLMGIEVRSARGPAKMKQSVIRNSSLGLIVLFLMVPVWGWILAILVGLPILLIETSLIFRADRRQRLGDAMAETEVVIYQRSPARSESE